MESPGKVQLLETVQHICVQHGFSREDFLCLMEASFGARVQCPERVSERDLHRFVMASLKWACPPHTPLMDARRAAARASWVKGAAENCSAAA